MLAASETMKEDLLRFAAGSQLQVFYPETGDTYLGVISRVDLRPQGDDFLVYVPFSRSARKLSGSDRWEKGTLSFYRGAMLRDLQLIRKEDGLLRVAYIPGEYILMFVKEGREEFAVI